MRSKGVSEGLGSAWNSAKGWLLQFFLFLLLLPSGVGEGLLPMEGRLSSGSLAFIRR